MTETHLSEVQRSRIAEMLSLAFIEIRHLGGTGQSRQAADLADVFHEVPREVFVRGAFSWDRLRGAVERYQAKHQRELFAFDYVTMLDEIRCIKQEDT
jgi:hypothetical protein